MILPHFGVPSLGACRCPPNTFSLAQFEAFDNHCEEEEDFVGLPTAGSIHMVNAMARLKFIENKVLQMPYVTFTTKVNTTFIRFSLYS